MTKAGGLPVFATPDEYGLGNKIRWRLISLWPSRFLLVQGPVSDEKLSAVLKAALINLALLPGNSLESLTSFQARSVFYGEVV